MLRQALSCCQAVARFRPRLSPCEAKKNCDRVVLLGKTISFFAHTVTFLPTGKRPSSNKFCHEVSRAMGMLC